MVKKIPDVVKKTLFFCLNFDVFFVPSRMIRSVQYFSNISTCDKIIYLSPQKTLHNLIHISFLWTFFWVMETANIRCAVNLANTVHGEAIRKPIRASSLFVSLNLLPTIQLTIDLPLVYNGVPRFHPLLHTGWRNSFKSA